MVELMGRWNNVDLRFLTARVRSWRKVSGGRAILRPLF